MVFGITITPLREARVHRQPRQVPSNRSIDPHFDREMGLWLELGPLPQLRVDRVLSKQLEASRYLPMELEGGSRGSDWRMFWNRRRDGQIPSKEGSQGGNLGCLAFARATRVR